jgi:hypothetical protein
VKSGYSSTLGGESGGKVEIGFVRSIRGICTDLDVKAAIRVRNGHFLAPCLGGRMRIPLSKITVVCHGEILIHVKVQVDREIGYLDQKLAAWRGPQTIHRAGLWIGTTRDVFGVAHVHVDAFGGGIAFAGYKWSRRDGRRWDSGLSGWNGNRW